LPVVIGCLLYVAMALLGVAHDSGTYDEFVHVTAGYSYWSFDDYRLNPENGNLAQRIVALPLVLSGSADSEFPTRDQPAWHRSDVWALSDQLFFAPGRNADALLFRARIMVVVVATMLGALVFCWSRALYGAPGAYVSFALYIFSPTMLAHGALATSDLIGAAFFAAAIWALWRALHRVTPMTVMVSLAAVGGMFIAKPSAPLIVPVALLMIVVHLIGNRPIVVHIGDEHVLSSRGARATAVGALAVAHAFVAWILIWAAYGFRFSAFAPGSPSTDTLLEPWASVFEHGSGMSTSLAQWGRAHHVLPEAYLYGLAVVVEYAKERTAFLNGAVSMRGWRSFFVYTTLYKTTLAALVLVACAAVAIVVAWRRQRASAQTQHDWTLPLYELTPLLIGVGMYGASALSSSLNIGHRHLLPIIPLVMILAGAVGPVAAAAEREALPWSRVDLAGVRRSLAAIGVVLLLGWHAAESIAIAPHYLAYFNELAGGPSSGYRHFIDSSLDWGQDLPGLKKWLDDAGLQQPNHDPVYLSYFGTAFPRYYKIDATLLPGFPDRSSPHQPLPLTAGVYCFSATMLQAVYLRPGPWNQRDEESYRQATRNLLAFDSTTADPVGRAAMTHRLGESAWADEFKNYEQLRTARLAAYLRRREPDEQIGHSILVYRVSDQDLNRALGGPQPGTNRQ
jgi:hypothetical protein